MQVGTVLRFRRLEDDVSAERHHRRSDRPRLDHPGAAGPVRLHGAMVSPPRYPSRPSRGAGRGAGFRGVALPSPHRTAIARFVPADAVRAGDAHRRRLREIVPRSRAMRLLLRSTPRRAAFARATPDRALRDAWRLDVAQRRTRFRSTVPSRRASSCASSTSFSGRRPRFGSCARRCATESQPCSPSSS